MIAYLEGALLRADDKRLVVLTSGGVGYEVWAPTSVLGALPKRGETTALFIHTQVGEKAIDLYGFNSAEDLDVFRTLISIDKLGPKKALAILSQFNADHLREIAFREDVKTLSTVPGIGPKSAKQILWHLKDKVDKLGKAGKGAGITLPTDAPATPQSEYFDALTGLKNLGYAEEEVRSMLKDIFEEEADIDAASAIRVALKRIASVK